MSTNKEALTETTTYIDLNSDSLVTTNDNIIILDDDKSNDISHKYNNFINLIDTCSNYDNIEKCNDNNIAEAFNCNNSKNISNLKLPPVTFNARINALPDAVIDYVADFVPKTILVEKLEPISSRPGDDDFDPVIAVVGNKGMANGEAFITHRDSLRLSSDESLQSSEKFLNDSLLFGLTTINFMKLSKKYCDTITYAQSHFYQVIGYEREVVATNDIKYDVLTRGKTSKDFQNFFKTIAFCFFVFLNAHVSFWSILFLRSLFYVDFTEAEVCSYLEYINIDLIINHNKKGAYKSLCRFH